MPLGRASSTAPVSAEQLQALWTELNARYFDARLPPISILWSVRLTASAGIFASRTGPRAPCHGSDPVGRERRLIRLSLPLLSSHPEGVRATLAHEMIHQWQFDLLKRRPNHGRDFCRMMHTMNRDGAGITVCHRLDHAVAGFLRYHWRCQCCGRDYRRQRRTLNPRRHRCGVCRGPLREIPTALEEAGSEYAPQAFGGANGQQLAFNFGDGG